MLLKCPNCQMTYSSAPEDFDLELSEPDRSALSGRIFFGRYGTDLNGRHIDYVFCADCSHITMVIPDAGFGLKLILALLGLAFPYKPFSAPISLFNIHGRINSEFDSSNKNIQTIFDEGFMLPAHIYKLLLKLKVFEIGDLGLLMYGRNCYLEDPDVMSFGNYVYAVENDVNIRKTQIEKRKRGDGSETSQQNFNKACEYFQAGNYEEAVKLFKNAADQGHSYAQNNLAEMHRLGQGVEQNENEAIKWFMKAAQQGIPNAQNNVGLACKTGEGTKQSDSEAVLWFRKAADHDDYEVHRGISEAQANLGMMYFMGRGVAKSDSEAVLWFRKAADQGNSEAQEYLEKLESILETENQIHNASEKITALIEEGEVEIDNYLDCLSDFVDMDSEEDHVFARILEDLVSSRSFGDAPQLGANDGPSLIGTSDWSPSMLMAYGYAMRVASAALYIQGNYTKEDYLSAKVVFTGLQLQTDQTVEFQDKAANGAIKFIAEYVDNFDLLFAQSIIGTAEGCEIHPGTFVDDDEFLRRMEEGRKLAQ